MNHIVGTGQGIVRRMSRFVVVALLVFLVASVAASAQNPQLGLFIRPNYATGDFSALSQFVTDSGTSPATWQAFYSWEDVNHNYVTFDEQSSTVGAWGPKAFCDYVYDVLGGIPQITWRPGWVDSSDQMEGASSAQPDFLLANLVDGRHYAYIKQFADDVKAYNRPIRIRIMHEMNAPNYPWGFNNPNNPGNTPAQYIAAWQYIVGIFRAEGVTNVEWVWNVGSGTFAGVTWTDFFPGDDWVDWVSMDGYNAQRQGCTQWKTMQDIFTQAYNAITAVSARPMSISETGSVEDCGGDVNKKANWITDGYLNILPTQFPRITAIYYFDNGGRGFTYPLNSSTEAWNAYLSVANSSLYNPAPDFTVAVTPSSQSGPRGGNVNFTVSITPLSGFNGTVNLTAVVQKVSGSINLSSWPVTFGPSSLSLPSQTTSTMNASIGPSAPTGAEVSVTVTATSGTLQHTASPVTVTATN